jgi:4-nitrophenyl phosphatase
VALTVDTLARVSTWIFDLDGVIWRGESPIEGAAASVERLRSIGKRAMFATNNSSRAPEHFAARLQAMGIQATPEDVVTSATATAFYVRAHLPGARVFVVGEEGVQTLLRQAGAQVMTAENADETQGVDLVVAGIDRKFDYHKLRLAQKFILSGARFIATNRDATFPVEGGVVPGAGSIVAAIECASGTVPLSMGKPEPNMLLGILERFHLRPDEAAIIGDRLDTDIACGARAGTGTVCVGTGVTPLEVARQASGEEKADLCFSDLPAMLEAMEGR